MLLANNNVLNKYESILKEELSPMTRAIDEEGVYPETVLRALGKAGAYQISELTYKEEMLKRLQLINIAARSCVSTSFLIWCHTTAISFISNSGNAYLKETLLPLLESGEVLAGTGLSNPMKYYAGMETLRLTAERHENGYTINGILPYVSNLGKGHWFGIIAQVDEEQRIFAMVNCDSLGLTLTEHKDFAGLNGTRSFTCRFDDVFLEDNVMISTSADDFVKTIRSSFMLTQTGMGIGLIKASVDTMQKCIKKQNESNKFIGVSTEHILDELEAVQHKIHDLFESTIEVPFNDAVQIRLQGAELALKTAEIAMLYQGAAGYLKKSDSMRRLREALFIAVVTPAIKHLKRMLHEQSNPLLGVN
ncbi:acyl-CoA dehydrogenase family protein [Bacillus benzoevorans]|uniref:Acyl-CoA dehydrogenase/oxidase N-terminal domain-containing protein n=1 Tax=Bacillus benzoevorans TaxID=1456 RepID=A0A7X0HSZ4_9BACI|nr:acyl-CoA dehydrogenase family protein [Bacillus benzoevorans]MBB6446288.1 hypothetical protein [Bacillus benzoevorans]